MFIDVRCLPLRRGVLNQGTVQVKENELRAAPQLLSGGEVHGKVVTGHALFTQRDLSSQLVEAGGADVWKVKDNPPPLPAAIERLFGPEQVPLGSAPLRTDFQAVTPTPQAHGRLEKHTLTTRSLLTPTRDWPYLGQGFQVVRAVASLKSGKPTHEVSYAFPRLSSQAASPRH